MITILHGQDQDSSYNRLGQIISSFKTHKLFQFDSGSQKDELQNAINSQDLFDDKKLIVIKNLLRKDKNVTSLLESAPKELEIICWEGDQLTPATAAKLAKFAKIEVFKLPSTLFYFLDSIAPGAKKIVANLHKIGEDSSLLWNIQNRFLLLSLAKLKLDAEFASKVAGRNLAPWQWQNIKSQAEKFDAKTLALLYKATLRIDYLTKSGKTNLPTNTMLSVMLLKYL